MTLDWIIERLRVSGCGTKQEVLKALKNATTKELQELEKSIENKLKESEHNGS